jgi:hypothetical protein
LEFLGERGAVKWVVLRDPQIDQALKLTLFISGATAGPGSSAQDNAFSVLLVGADGIQQAYGGESSNLSGAGTQEVGLVVNEFSPVLLTSQLGPMQYGMNQWVLFDPVEVGQYRYPVLALRIEHLNDDQGGQVDIFDPDFVAGTVFYEVED